MDRLGALGNALIPQIAEWIGSRILAFESARGVGLSDPRLMRDAAEPDAGEDGGPAACGGAECFGIPQPADDRGGPPTLKSLPQPKARI
jgi:hypothetical protein